MSANTVPRYAVVPTHNRHDELKQLIQALLPHINMTVVIDNASTPTISMPDVVSCVDTPNWPDVIHVIHDNEQPPNLSRLWNVGLDFIDDDARARGFTQWDIMIINDDVDIPAEWFSAVFHQLRARNVVAVSTHAIRSVSEVRELRRPNEGGLYWRLCPWAFVIRGELGIRADERLRWWYGDTDLDWSARNLGGVAIVPGPVVTNKHANSTTVGALAEQAGRDRETFAAKWGAAPW